ncbi:MAG: hypothetical protein NC213_08290 [Acetobacter sp.]|nr:hypothetical protein [Bacteroides sp.]MCM1341728.1 hypothetical protein [Acetobacter sp.]MCM1432333.1 hypothetical protein [Clostridiales bacterium]
MKIVTETVNGVIKEIENVCELSFIQSADAACDSLSIYFKPDESYDEIAFVRLYENDEIIFNGICDCQKTSEDDNGFEIYLYARSNASVLVDNEAEPFTYNAPSAKQLCYSCTDSFGFKCMLPDIYSDEKYVVPRGTSSYAAVNQFVYLCTGNSIAVTSNNELILLELSDNIKCLNTYKVISSKETINRSEPITQINFKRSLNPNGYEMHMKAKTADELKIMKSKYVNQASYADWQRDFTILQKIKKSFDSYKLLDVVVSGYVSDKLLQRFSYNSKKSEFVDYALVEKRYICDQYGERTRLTLRKIIDVKEIIYVD